MGDVATEAYVSIKFHDAVAPVIIAAVEHDDVIVEIRAVGVLIGTRREGVRSAEVEFARDIEIHACSHSAPCSVLVAAVTHIGCIHLCVAAITDL